MKFKGELRNPTLQKYYVTGSLEKKVDNSALQKMLSKIKNGGINAFLNDSELKNFAKGMRESFKSEGLMNADDSLTATGEDVVNTGKSWRGLQGAFFFTVLNYNGEQYLLDAELVNEQNIKNSDGKVIVDFQNTVQSFSFEENEYQTTDSSIRNIESDSDWAQAKIQPDQSSVKFCFDYETETCTVDVSWKDGQKYKKCSFTTTENSAFQIIDMSKALDLLEKRENDEGVFEFSNKDRKSIRLKVNSEDQLLNKKDLLDSFFDAGSVTFKGIVFRDNEATSCEISDVCLYIDSNDEKTSYALLNEYLLRKAESSYLGYSEVGHLVNEFQDLFTSPNEYEPACPQVMQTTEEIYDGLVERAKQTASVNPLAYLHLKAFMDLSPENTIKPYIEKESTVNLSNQKISFSKLAETVFGSDRNVKEIFMFSKYTAANGRNARAVKLFAESTASLFGVKPVLVTTKEEVRPSPKRNVAESDRFWFEKMKEVVTVKEKPVKEIESIHDRYYKVVRDDGRIEWYVLTGELDSLRFENDHPRIREDISVTEQGTVKEMTFSKIKQAGVPETVVKLMEAK